MNGEAELIPTGDRASAEGTMEEEPGWPQSEEEFRAFVRHLQVRMIGYAARRLGNLADAEDVFQEVMLKVYRGRSQGDGVRHARAYLYRMIGNECTDLLRRREKQRRRGDIREIEMIAAPGGSARERMVQLEAAQRIDRLLDGLPARQAEVVRLRFYAGLSFSEIAEALGCSVSTVSSRLNYALKKLSKRAKKEDFHELRDL